MERATAVKKLKALLGPKAYWRIGAHLTSPERRLARTKNLLLTQFSIAMLKRDMGIRQRELLKADTLYQALNAERIKQQAAFDAIPEAGFRFEAGVQSGGALNFISPKAYGDTWEEIFQKLAQKKEEGAA